MPENLEKRIIEIVEDMKGENIVSLDVTQLTSMMDTVLIVSGTSTRHVKSIAAKVVETLKHEGHPPLGVEGLDQGEWVLVDCGDVVLHSMLPETRKFYDLEKLWAVPARAMDANSGETGD